jgi:predicted O-methyltransferase YrrM
LKVLGHWAEKEVQMLEVGSHEGRSAIWWTQNILQHPKSRLTCVDPWANKEALRRFVKNVTKAGLGLKIRGFNVKIADAKVAPNHYDLCYLDGSHAAHDVYSDLLICWRGLKKGGVLVCDDYGLNAKHMIGPKPAIDGFLASFRGQYRLLSQGCQVIIKKLV